VRAGLAGERRGPAGRRGASTGQRLNIKSGKKMCILMNITVYKGWKNEILDTFELVSCDERALYERRGPAAQREA